MDKLLLICIWLAAGLILICGLVALHLRKGSPLNLRLRGLGIEVNIESGNVHHSEPSTTMVVEASKDD